MSTKDDALWETMCECVFGATWTGAQAGAMRRALRVARKAILEEAASMVERSYEGACYEGISRFIAADIRALIEAKP
jgi:hypothetical protein